MKSLVFILLAISVHHTIQYKRTEDYKLIRPENSPEENGEDSINSERTSIEDYRSLDNYGLEDILPNFQRYLYYNQGYRDGQRMCRPLRWRNITKLKDWLLNLFKGVGKKPKPPKATLKPNVKPKPNSPKGSKKPIVTKGTKKPISTKGSKKTKGTKGSKKTRGPKGTKKPRKTTKDPGGDDDDDDESESFELDSNDTNNIGAKTLLGYEKLEYKKMELPMIIAEPAWGGDE